MTDRRAIETGLARFTVLSVAIALLLIGTVGSDQKPPDPSQQW